MKVSLIDIFKVFFFTFFSLFVYSGSSFADIRHIHQENQKKVLSFQIYYFQLRELGEFSAAYNFFTERQKSNISLEDFSQSWRLIRSKYGNLTSLENRKVTFYENPQGAPKGLYAAV
ncbi:MAG: hypothetical protein AAGD96_28720, partial [Chloroflexota bacterium]